MQSTARPRVVESSAEDSVLTALMSIARLMRQRIGADGLDPGTFWLLRTLAPEKSLRVTDLASCANLDTSTISRHVAQLHRLGLIDRTPDPDDRRAQRVALTPLGRDQLERALAQRRAVLTRSLADWDRNDIAHFERLLARFAGDIEQTTTDLEHI